MPFVKPLLAALFLTGVAFAATPASAATITVTFERVSDQGGNVRAGLFNQEKFDAQEGEPLIDAIVPAASPRTVLKFENVKPGTYAIKALNDVNKNGKMDFFLFLPTEKYGFSNDAKPDMMRLKQPDFHHAKFQVGEHNIAITIHFR